MWRTCSFPTGWAQGRHQGDKISQTFLPLHHIKLINTLLALSCSGSLFAQGNTQAIQNELIIRQKNGKEIYGVISCPDTKGKHGVAIISHGFKPEETALSNRYIKEFL